MKKEIEINEKLARIHAHLCGDGSVYKYKTKQKGRKFIAVVGYYNKNQKLLDKFRSDFSDLFKVKMKMRFNREVSISSHRLYDYFNDNFGSFKSKEWRIPEIIKNNNSSIKLEWLKAFFEDEAYDEKRYNRLKIKSVNPEGLKDAKELLDSLEIESSLTGPNCDGSYYLTLHRFNEIKEFSDFVKEPVRS